jgi:hypothetical protein
MSMHLIMLKWLHDINFDGSGIKRETSSATGFYLNWTSAPYKVKAVFDISFYPMRLKH